MRTLAEHRGGDNARVAFERLRSRAPPAAHTALVAPPPERALRSCVHAQRSPPQLLLPDCRRRRHTGATGRAWRSAVVAHHCRKGEGSGGIEEHLPGPADCRTIEFDFPVKTNSAIGQQAEQTIARRRIINTQSVVCSFIMVLRCSSDGER